jgi:hypothetical protein
VAAAVRMALPVLGAMRGEKNISLNTADSLTPATPPWEWLGMARC